MARRRDSSSLERIKTRRGPPAAQRSDVVSGKVTGAGGAPLDEAWVVATSGELRELTLTDREGRYEMRLHRGGTWNMTFEAEHHAVRTRTVDVAGAVRVDAALEPLARIRGRVRNHVPGVAVQATGADGLIYRGTVDATGAFGFQVESGSYELHLVAHGFHWQPERTVRVASGREARATLSLEQLGSLRGRLHLPGPDVESIRISLEHVATGQTRIVPGDTGFLVRNLALGAYIVEATLKPGGQRLAASVEIVADATASVELGANQAVIEGFLTPARTATVRLHAFLDDEIVESRAALTTRTAADGRFEFRGLEPGAYLVVCEDGDACDSRRVVVAPHTSTGVHLTLTDAVHEVRVGEPFADKTVQLIRQPFLRLRRFARADADGVVRVRGVPPGRYLVRCGRRKTIVNLVGRD